MAEFSELKVELARYLDAQAINDVERAYQLGADAHKDQIRVSGEPYITHPLAVAKILAEMRLDKQTVIAAILHDVIEDTDIDKESLTQEFGKEVAQLVDGVSKLTQISFESKAEAQAANFRKMMMAMTHDIRVILIKLADRLHNMRTLSHLAPKKRYRIAKETLEIYAPIANRLGMRAFRDELSDLAFYRLYPLRYQVLENSIRQARGNRKEILTQIEMAISGALKAAGIERFTVKGREKNLYSIYKKMRDKHLHLSEIMDVYGFRIVVDSVDLCYRALGVVHSLYKPVPERFKDYIAIPKANGYQSLHTTLFGPYGLPLETQIRTVEMDRLAENGIASHWLYKSAEGSINQAELKIREWIKGVLEIQKNAGNSLEFIENVKIDLFPDEVYVFTPQGDILKLPTGATAVDFAYAVHSDIGDSCIAAKVDKRLISLSTPLKSGQTIEIVTVPGSQPNPAWLNFVVTAKARSHIRSYLKKLQHQEAMQLGQRLLESALAQFESVVSISEEELNKLAHSLNYKTKEELYEAIGFGNQMAPIIAQRLLNCEEVIAASMATGKRSDLVIKGTEGMAVTFAKCCYPIPGDLVTGVLTTGRGVVVHADHCANIQELRHKHPEKCLPIRWEEDVFGEFSVAIQLELDNQRGTLAVLALAIANAESNIEDIQVLSHEGKLNKLLLIVTVNNRVHLARVIRRLRQTHQVHKITRSRQVALKHINEEGKR